ncbi:MAG: hypothetical protein ACRELB_24465, partial [Polyangiaceae bacterium]
MPSILDILCGVFWAAAYALIIKRGFQDKACGMPVLVLCVNFGWELLSLTFRRLPETTPAAYMCVPLDAVIFVQCLMYGKADFENAFVKKYFHAIVVGTFVYVTAFVYLFETRLHDEYRYYSAFCDNLVMSALFIAMLLRRGSSRGQSMYIAVFKLLGTLVVSIEALRLHRDPEPAFLILL